MEDIKNDIQNIIIEILDKFDKLDYSFLDENIKNLISKIEILLTKISSHLNKIIRNVPSAFLEKDFYKLQDYINNFISLYKNLKKQLNKQTNKIIYIEFLNLFCTFEDKMTILSCIWKYNIHQLFIKIFINNLEIKWDPIYSRIERVFSHKTQNSYQFLQKFNRKRESFEQVYIELSNNLDQLDVNRNAKMTIMNVIVYSRLCEKFVCDDIDIFSKLKINKIIIENKLENFYHGITKDKTISNFIQQSLILIENFNQKRIINSENVINKLKQLTIQLSDNNKIFISNEFFNELNHPNKKIYNNKQVKILLSDNFIIELINIKKDLINKFNLKITDIPNNQLREVENNIFTELKDCITTYYYNYFDIPSSLNFKEVIQREKLNNQQYINSYIDLLIEPRSCDLIDKLKAAIKSLERIRCTLINDSVVELYNQLNRRLAHEQSI
jgi:hypothetical protein